MTGTVTPGWETQNPVDENQAQGVGGREKSGGVNTVEVEGVVGVILVVKEELVGVIPVKEEVVGVILVETEEVVGVIPVKAVVERRVEMEHLVGGRVEGRSVMLWRITMLVREDRHWWGQECWCGNSIGAVLVGHCSPGTRKGPRTPVDSLQRSP